MLEILKNAPIQTYTKPKKKTKISILKAETTKSTATNNNKGIKIGLHPM